jgi:hypothetical protein
MRGQHGTVLRMSAPFTLQASGEGTAILTVPMPGAAPVRLELDEAAARELRDGIDAAVALGASGGQGPVHTFAVGDATVTVAAAPGGSLNLRIDR